jgi:acyl-CoA thioester hydrolase
MYKEIFEVRDNEVDAQGVVNNANYFIYMAHARHKYLDKIGINFHEMAINNQQLFLTSSNIEFKKPLKANDKFYISCKMIKSGAIRICFEQELRLIENNELLATGTNIGVCMDGNKKRPYIPELIQNNFSD